MAVAHVYAVGNLQVKFLDACVLGIVWLDSQTFEHIAQGFEVEELRWSFAQDKGCLS